MKSSVWLGALGTGPVATSVLVGYPTAIGSLAGKLIRALD
jgi:hypothetical protein